MSIPSKSNRTLDSQRYIYDHTIALTPKKNTEIATENHIQYIPFERKIIEYEPVQKVQRVPREYTQVVYQKVKKKGVRPVERRVVDFYEIEHVVEYEQEHVVEKRIQYVQREVPEYQVQYLPFQRQIVHIPSNRPFLQTHSPPQTKQLFAFQNILTQEYLANIKGFVSLVPHKTKQAVWIKQNSYLITLDHQFLTAIGNSLTLHPNSIQNNQWNIDPLNEIVGIRRIDSELCVSMKNGKGLVGLEKWQGQKSQLWRKIWLQ